MNLIYEVSGFRSLRGTHFQLNSGLNVLVGPNGSGKTNISALIDFVSSFAHEGAHVALAKAGGSSRVFSNESLIEGGDRPMLSIKVRGRFKYSEPMDLFTTKLRLKDVPAEFEYALVLQLNTETFDVEIEEESLNVTVDATSESEAIKQEFIASSTDRAKNRANIELPRDDAFMHEMFSDKFRKLFKGRPDKGAPATVQDRLYNNALAHMSLLNICASNRQHAGIQILSALSFRRTINIDPIKMREPEDIASDRNLKADGKGTVGRLYAVISSQTPSPNSSHHPKSRTFKRILSDVRRVNKQIVDISIEPNMSTGKFRCSFTVKGESGLKLTLPLAAVSDGTAKWLAIITAIRTDHASVSIEEPENYLHPSAQTSLIKILRDTDKASESIFLLTTHSETIINNVKPQELLVCEYRNLTTQVRRLQHPERILGAINKTGFGLGFLYAQDRV